MMEIFQTLWTVFTTENELLLTIIGFFSCFIEAFVNLLLFTTILNINCDKKYKLIYVILIPCIAILIRNLILDPYSIILNIVLGIIIIKFLLRVSWVNAFLAEFITMFASALLETFLLKFFEKAFSLSYEVVMNIPLYRAIFTLSIYVCIYILYRIIKYFKFNLNLDNMTKNNKILFVVNMILGFIAIFMQFYLIAFYNSTMPLGVTIVSIVTLCAYFFLSIYSLLSATKLEATSRNLTEAQLYNKTLTLLHDSMRGFKHDFHNIVQGLGGYIETENIDGLKKYYSQLLKDCNRVNNLTALNPSIINNPAIYNVMATKYHKADEIGVQINLGIFIDLNEFEKHMRIYEFTRILGILMDNAIEAASECTDKVIHVSFKNEENRHRLVMVIENTYLDKDINIDKIFEKDFSTKSQKTNSGLGLWEIRQILKRNNNLNLFTTKNEEYFMQQFEIYY